MTDPRPRLPPGAVLVDLAAFKALLDAGATRQELRRWLAEQAARGHHDDEQEGGDRATA